MLILKTLVLYADTSAKTDIGEHAFDSCFNLENIINGGYAKSLGECCFKNCRSLYSFYLPGDLNIRVNAFDGCSDDCRLNMLRQISDPRYQKAVFWPILTSDKEPEEAEEAKKAGFQISIEPSALDFKLYIETHIYKMCLTMDIMTIKGFKNNTRAEQLVAIDFANRILARITKDEYNKIARGEQRLTKIRALLDILEKEDEEVAVEALIGSGFQRQKIF